MSATSSTRNTSRRPRHDVLGAWLCLVAIPVALVVADGVLHGVLSLLGVDEGDESPNLGQMLLAGLPYTLVMLLPAIGAVWFGTNALRDGDGRGRIPSIIGMLWGLIVLVGAVVLLVAS